MMRERRNFVQWVSRLLPTAALLLLARSPECTAAPEGAELTVSIVSDSSDRTWKLLSRPIGYHRGGRNRFGVRLIRGDLDGDGVDEMLVEWSGLATYTAYSIAGGSVKERRTFDLPIDAAAYIPSATDVDGDGAAEILWPAPAARGFYAAKPFLDSKSHEPETRLIRFPKGGNYTLFTLETSWRCRDGESPEVLFVSNDITGIRDRQEKHLVGCFNPSRPDLAPRFYTYVWSFIPFAAIHALGARRDELLFFDNGTGEFYILRDEAEDSLAMQIWADFSPYLPFAFWQGRIIGDFNGDGLDDIVPYSGRFSDARVAWSRGTHAVEADFRWPFTITDTRPTVAGDFDGDGMSDIVKIGSEGYTLEVALNTPIPSLGRPASVLLFLPLRFPLADLTPALPVLGFGRAGGDGSAVFEGLAPGEYFVEVYPDDLDAAKGRRRILRVKPAQRSIRRVLAVPPSPESIPAPAAIGRLSDGWPGSAQVPKVCIGYNPFHRDAVRSRGKWEEVDGVCPAAYAFFSSSEGSREGPRRSSLQTQCCPLPAGDILTSEHEWVEKSCRDGWVATGEADSKSGFQLRCTKVNAARYQLGPPSPAAYWGSGLSGRNQGKHVAFAEIPEAIRYGVNRAGRNGTFIDGCVGLPFGSLLTEKGANKCYEAIYRPLLFRGAPGDPPSGTPVKMFPDCRLIEDIFFGDSGCFP